MALERASRFMGGLVHSGRVVDFILLVMVLEFMGLTLLRLRVRSGALRAPGSLDRLLSFAPGVCLLMALRAALTGAGWISVLAFLTLSFPFHLADLARRRL